MTKDEWDRVQKSVEGCAGRARLEIDGYMVDLFLLSVSPYKKEIAVYINSAIRVDWALGKTEESKDICRRFYFPHKTCLVRKPKRKLSKKEQAIWNEEKEKYTYVSYFPYWNSFRSLKQHLIKNNENIKIMEVDQNA